MAIVPAKVAETNLSLFLQKFLQLLGRGKVRDTWGIPGELDLLLVVATDRISIFDFVLRAFVPGKGEVLTAMTVFWLTQVITGYRDHLVAYGKSIDRYLPAKLRDNPELQRRALVVQRQKMFVYECIVRGWLSGSGWSAYQKSQSVCGIPLPAGLNDGSRLDPPIYTPTTKAEEGHDEHVDRDFLREKHGMWSERMALDLYLQGVRYAGSRSIILADTKFEFGEEVLADEVLTPDSSRFWRVSDWEEAQALPTPKSPAGYDKQPVRDWGARTILPNGQYINSKLDAKDPAMHELVATVDVPTEVTQACAERYLEIFQILTGRSLAEYQRNRMGIKEQV